MKQHKTPPPSVAALGAPTGTARSATATPAAPAEIVKGAPTPTTPAGSGGAGCVEISQGAAVKGPIKPK